MEYLGKILKGSNDELGAIMDELKTEMQGVSANIQASTEGQALQLNALNILSQSIELKQTLTKAGADLVTANTPIQSLSGASAGDFNASVNESCYVDIYKADYDYAVAGADYIDLKAKTATNPLYYQKILSNVDSIEFYIECIENEDGWYDQTSYHDLKAVIIDDLASWKTVMDTGSALADWTGADQIDDISIRNATYTMDLSGIDTTNKYFVICLSSKQQYTASHLHMTNFKMMDSQGVTVQELFDQWQGMTEQTDHLEVEGGSAFGVGKMTVSGLTVSKFISLDILGDCAELILKDADGEIIKTATETELTNRMVDISDIQTATFDIIYTLTGEQTLSAVAVRYIS